MPITIHLTGEITPRIRSTPYKGEMYAAYPGDIVFSKIDARNGAIGIVPQRIAKAIVTPEFPVFIADAHRLNGEFMKLVLRTGGFLSDLRRRATGTSGRKRIVPTAFLDMRIPLPSLIEQQAIVAAFDATMNDAENCAHQAAEAEAQALATFEAALGFLQHDSVPLQPVLIANFKEMERWSHEGIVSRTIEATRAHTLSYPPAKLRDVVADLENGWSPKCLTRPAEDSEWGVLKLGAVSFGAFDESENKALPKHLKPKSALEVKAGQILISRANVTRLVGATTLIEATRDKLMLCDKIFRVVMRTPSPIDGRFLLEVLRTSAVRIQIESKVTGTSPTMKNISKPSLLGLTFPLPPIKDQIALAIAVSNARNAASGYRARADDLRTKAWMDFERSIYAVANASAGSA